MIKIAFTGAQGVGKTTIVEALKNKLESDDKLVELLPELIRDCPYPADVESTFNTQLWVSSHTVMRETDLADKADILLVDRPITDIGVYKELVKGNKGMTEAQDALLTGMINSWKDTYDVFFHITVPLEQWKTRDIDDGFRSTDEGVYKFLAEGFAKVVPDGHHHIENIDLNGSINGAYEIIKKAL